MDLANELAALRAESARKATPERVALYESKIEELRRSGILETALAPGASAPDFRLPDASGQMVALADLERGKRVVPSRTRALRGIERRLAMQADEDWRGDELLALPELAYLRNKSREELLSIQQTTQVELKRYEEGLRIAATILAERGEQVR
jgi:hypothetical protein